MAPGPKQRIKKPGAREEAGRTGAGRNQKTRKTRLPLTKKPARQSLRGFYSRACSRMTRMAGDDELEALLADMRAAPGATVRSPGTPKRRKKQGERSAGESGEVPVLVTVGGC